MSFTILYCGLESIRVKQAEGLLRNEYISLSIVEMCMRTPRSYQTLPNLPITSLGTYIVFTNPPSIHGVVFCLGHGEHRSELTPPRANTHVWSPTKPLIRWHLARQDETFVPVPPIRSYSCEHTVRFSAVVLGCFKD